MVSGQLLEDFRGQLVSTYINCSLDLISVLDFHVWLNLEACGFQPRKPLYKSKDHDIIPMGPIPSMGRLYIYLHACLMFMVNVQDMYELPSSTGFLAPSPGPSLGMLVSGSEKP